MENQKIFKTPNKTLAQMQVVHLGKILFNLQFVVLVIMLASFITFMLPAIYYLFLICIALITLFTAFTNASYTALWTKGETLTKIAEIMTQSWKYTVPILLVLAVTSIVCLCMDRNNKHIARIVVSSILCVLAVIVLIFKLINGRAI